MEVIDPSDVWSMWRVVPRQKIERKQVFFSQQQALFVFLTCILTFLCGRTDNHLIQPRLGNGHVCCHIFTLFLTQSHSLEIHFTYNLICLDWLPGALVGSQEPWLVGSQGPWLLLEGTREQSLSYYVDSTFCIVNVQDTHICSCNAS